VGRDEPVHQIHALGVVEDDDLHATGFLTRKHRDEELAAATGRDTFSRESRGRQTRYASPPRNVLFSPITTREMP